MVKVFTVNKNGKIEITKEELQKLLDESYWDGYRANSYNWTYTSPNWEPYRWSSTTVASSGNATTTYTLNSNIESNESCINNTGN